MRGTTARVTRRSALGAALLRYDGPWFWWAARMHNVPNAVVLRFVLLVGLVLVGRADAGRSKKPILVLEAHVGERSAEVSKWMEPLDDELETHGFAARASTILGVIGSQVPRPGILDPSTTAAEIKQRIDSGYGAFTAGRFDEASKMLIDAIEKVHRNPSLLVADTGNADMTYNAYVALALSQAKKGQASESVRTMSELIRMFPSRPISRTEFGPQAEQFYKSVYKEVQGRGRGGLSIAAGDAKAVVFVDGQIRGMGKAALADLIPGTYRVMVQVPGTLGRQYAVDVQANDDAFLKVESDIDSSLWVTDTWVGFQFATDAERTKEAKFATQLARRWTDGELVAVIGTLQIQGKPALIGTLYETNGAVLRSAIVTTERADTTTLRSLARFLADGTPGDGIQIMQQPDAPTRAPTAATLTRTTRVPKLVVAAGVGLVIAGAVMYALDEDPERDGGPRYNDTAPAGVALGVSGVVLAGVGTWLWLRAGNRDSAPIASVGTSQGFVGWAGSF